MEFNIEIIERARRIKEAGINVGGILKAHEAASANRAASKKFIQKGTDTSVEAFGKTIKPAKDSAKALGIKPDNMHTSLNLR